jgi:Rod binding domain-containing protein
MPVPAMNVALSANWNNMTAANPPAVKCDVTKNKKAARDFEAMLLTPVLDSLQKTFSGDPEDSTPGASDYRLMGTQALASAIAERGGIGIARLVLSHLQTPKVPGKG